MSELKSIDLSNVKASFFKDHLNTDFSLSGEVGEFPATLLEVTEYPDRRGNDDRQVRQGFALVFQCDAAVLPQGIYTLGHSVLPSFDLFLSPFEGGENGCKLEAIFN